MKRILIPLSVIWLSGCASYVKTYDSSMNLIGACKSGIVLFGFIPISPIGMGTCRGEAK